MSVEEAAKHLMEVLVNEAHNAVTNHIRYHLEAGALAYHEIYGGLLNQTEQTMASGGYGGAVVRAMVEMEIALSNSADPITTEDIP